MPMIARRRNFLAPLSLVAGMLFAAPLPSQASAGSRYVVLRYQNHYNRNVSYAQVLQSAGTYVGTVIELRGRVGGVMTSPDKVSIMLSLDDGNAPVIDVPKSEAALLQNSTTPFVRVLARVQPNSSGNVPILKVIAVAYDSEVNTEEARGEARALAEAESRRLAATGRRSRSSRSSTVYASRGNFNRQSSFAGASSVPGNLPAEVQNIFPYYFNFIAGYNRRLTSDQVTTITAHLLNAAYENQVEPRLVVAMIISESGFDPNSTSRSGAMGLGQLMPGTARDLGLNNAYDPMQNLYGSIRYLKSRLATFGTFDSPRDPSDQQISLAMAAYNAGMGAVRKYKGVPPYRETQAYVRRVLSLYHKLKGS